MYYTPTHDWLKPHEEDLSLARVGITSFAQKEIGEIVFVELPAVGTIFKKGDPVAVIESTKAAIDIYAIADGMVVSVNEALKENPGLINQSPQEEGWLYFMRLHANVLELYATLDDEPQLADH